MTERTDVRQPIAESWATSNQAPLWIAVALYAAANADPATGRAIMQPNQLRRAVAPGASGSTLSQAIRRAVRAGWLDASSSAWCLQLGRPHGA